MDAPLWSLQNGFLRRGLRDWPQRALVAPNALWPVSDRASFGFSTHLKHTHLTSAASGVYSPCL